MTAPGSRCHAPLRKVLTRTIAGTVSPEDQTAPLSRKSWPEAGVVSVAWTVIRLGARVAAPAGVVAVIVAAAASAPTRAVTRRAVVFMVPPDGFRAARPRVAV